MTPERSDRRIFLGMPGYGEQTSGAGRGFWRASRLPDNLDVKSPDGGRVYHHYEEGSLLARNFNMLWCTALNLAHHGERIDYFAMIHADVAPTPYWLDALIDELEAHNLDILGVAIPIKTHHGLTSIALQRPDGDTWRQHCRLTMHDLYRLPPTFTSEDVGYPLLLNTGLWVCRFDESWARKVHFTVNDEIVVRPDGLYHVHCEPEDWFFSRCCHELGLRIGATRKVHVEHRGPMAFPNTHAWGSGVDSAYVEKSPLREDGPALPDITGWLRYEEGEKLAELARGKWVLEVGSYCGLSTVCLARTAEHVVAVDPHDGRATPHPRNTLAELRANLSRYGVADKVTIKAETFAACEAWGPFDLIYIDGAHDRASVESDLRHALALLAPDGLIAFHDYRTLEHPDVSTVVDELISSGGELVSVTASLAVVRPPAEVPQLLEV